MSDNICSTQPSSFQPAENRFRQIPLDRPSKCLLQVRIRDAASVVFQVGLAIGQDLVLRQFLQLLVEKFEDSFVGRHEPCLFQRFFGRAGPRRSRMIK